MIPQDLEDLLKTKTFFYSDTNPLQESIDSAIAKLRSDGKKMVITNVFADNTIWIGKKIFVPDENDNQKEISVISKPVQSVYQLEFEYFDPNEVKNF